ncbi:type II secretion system protein [Arsukibacterium indicum]|uniref:Type II secretion system GspH family protein n=1 Tax=Arsukibacterium indicum TaxID=2848612 RepID=A0ABS6MG48_9GAMM|nr:type II secretion system protein [Arsukibacterium indicum]MBV2127788.1 type II secretion system GspH family protein [Arsukibacterium indicum]
MAASGFLKRGFTLVELLIAMSIMLGMLVLAATAYQLYTDSWRRDLSNIERAYQNYRNNELLLDAMQAILPMAVTDQGNRAFYFLGREEGFTAVTYSPIFNIGYPAVIRVFREANADGTFQLVYEEASLQHTVLKSADQTLPFNKRRIISTDLSELSFSYYGWESIEVRMAAMANIDVSLTAQAQWFDEYDALRRRLHPQKIKIVMADFTLEFAVADRSRLNISREELENPL